MKTRSWSRTKLSQASTKRSGCLLLSKQTKHKQKQKHKVSTPKVPSQRRSRLETVTGNQGQYGGMIELELCEEDQCSESLGNLQVTLISADERKPRFVLVCSEESNWFTPLRRVSFST